MSSIIDFILGRKKKPLMAARTLAVIKSKIPYTKISHPTGL